MFYDPNSVGRATPLRHGAFKEERISPVSVTLRQLAELVEGRVIGDGDLIIRAARALGEAGAGDITLVESERNTTQLQQSHAAAAVVPPSMPINGKALIQVADPLMAFA